MWKVCLPFSPGILLFLNSPVSSESLRFSAFFFSVLVLFLVTSPKLCCSSPGGELHAPVALYRLFCSGLSVYCLWVTDEQQPWVFPGMLLWALLHCGEPRVRGTGNSSERTHIYMWKAACMFPTKTKPDNSLPYGGGFFSSQLYQIVNSLFLFQHLLIDQSKAKRRNKQSTSAKQEIYDSISNH